MLNKIEVLQALQNKGYYIHNNTSDVGRRWINDLCSKIQVELNLEKEDEICVLNIEVAPTCDIGIIYRSDMFNLLTIYGDFNNETIVEQIKKFKKS